MNKEVKEMELKPLANNRGFSLQFYSNDEPKALFAFLKDVHSDACHQLADNLADRLSDRYAHDLVKLTTPIWFEELPTLVMALYVNTATLNVKMTSAILHADDLYNKWEKKRGEKLVDPLTVVPKDKVNLKTK